MAFSDSMIGSDDFDPQTASEDLIRRLMPEENLPKNIDPNMVQTRLMRKLDAEPPKVKTPEKAKTPALDFSGQAIPTDANPDMKPSDDLDFTSQVQQPAAPVPPQGVVSANLKGGFKGLGAGALESTGGILKGGAALYDNGVPAAPAMPQYDPMGNPLGTQSEPTEAIAAKPLQERTLYKAGQAVEHAAPEMTPAEQDSVLGRTGKMIGAIAPYAAVTALAGPEAGMAAGFGGMAADTYGKVYEDALKHGADEATARGAAQKSALAAGTLGALPLGSGAYAKSLIGKVATSGATFATLGEAQEAVLRQIEKDYNPEAGYSADAKRIIASLITGGLMGGLHHAFRDKPDEAIPDEPAKPAAPGAIPNYESDRSSSQRGGSGTSNGPQPEREEASARGAGPESPGPDTGAAGARSGGPEPGPQPGGPGTESPGSESDQQYQERRQQEKAERSTRGKASEEDKSGVGRDKLEAILRKYGYTAAEVSAMSHEEMRNAVRDEMRRDGPRAKPETPEERAARENLETKRTEDDILRKAGWSEAHINAMTPEQRADYIGRAQGRSEPPKTEQGKNDESVSGEQPQQQAEPPHGMSREQASFLKKNGWTDEDIANHSNPEELKTELGKRSPADVEGTRGNPIVAKSAEDVARAEAAEPTAAQASAENYRHAHIELPQLGLKGDRSISVETGVGQKRKGVGEDGKPWEVEMTHGAYGRIKGTTGADGQPLDIFVGPKPSSPHVFVIDQHDPVTGDFDEHKIMAGYETPQEAIAAYARSYNDKGEKRIGHVKAMGPEDFQRWITGDTTKPLKEGVPSAPRSAVSVGADGKPLTPASTQGAPAEATKVSPQGKSGVSKEQTSTQRSGSKPMTDNLSLLQFIASKGGLAPHPELDAMDLTGKHRVQIPGRKGFFAVVRPGGANLDTMREAAEEAGYFRGDIHRTSTVTDFLDAIAAEKKGQKLHAEGEEGSKTKAELKAESEREEHDKAKIQDLVDQLDAAGHAEAGPTLKARALKLMATEGMEPDEAIETALVQLDSEEAERTGDAVDLDGIVGPGTQNEVDAATAHEAGREDVRAGSEGTAGAESVPAESGARASSAGEEEERPSTEADVENEAEANNRRHRFAIERATDERWKELVDPDVKDVHPGDRFAATRINVEHGSLTVANARKLMKAAGEEEIPHEESIDILARSKIEKLQGGEAIRFPYKDENAQGRMWATIVGIEGGYIKLRNGSANPTQKLRDLIENPPAPLPPPGEEPHETAESEDQGGEPANTIHGRPIVDSVADARKLARSNQYEQDPTRAGQCYPLAGKYVRKSGGTYTIATMGGDEVYHAVVEQEHNGTTYVYDPTMKWDGWLSREALSAIAGGYRPVHWMTGDEVKQFGKDTGYFPDPATMEMPPIGYWRGKPADAVWQPKEKSRMQKTIDRSREQAERTNQREDARHADSLMKELPGAKIVEGEGGKFALNVGGEVKTGYHAYRTDAIKEYRRAQSEPETEVGADNKEQLVIPGAEKASDKTMAQRAAAAPLKARANQKPMDTGLFGTEKDQTDIFDQVKKVEAALGPDVNKVEPVDVQRAGEIMAANPGMTPANAFGRAVIVNAVEQGQLTPVQVEQAYGPEAKDLLGTEREGTSGGGAHVEPSSAAPDEEFTGHATENGELPSGGETGEAQREPGAEAAGAGTDHADVPEATEHGAAGRDEAADEQASDAVENQPSTEPPDYTGHTELERVKDVAKRINKGAITAEELKKEFARARENEDIIKRTLSLKTIKELAPRGASGRTKPQLVKEIYQNLIGNFTVNGGYQWSPMTETVEQAVAREVAKITDADIARAAQKRRENTEEFKQRYTNPQTLDQFESFIRARGADKLTPEQRKTYDELVAQRNAEQRARDAERNAKIAKVDTPAEMTITETVHTKRGIPLFVVQLSARVERDVYDKLNSAAKKLGGYYSAYNKGGAVPGFQFKTREAAETFAAVREGDQSRSDLNAQRADQRQENAVEALRGQAERLASAADETMNADRKVNTARRANMAAGAEARAASDKALATTMSSIADAIESGEAKHLGFVRTKSEVEMLNRILRDSKRQWIERQKPVGHREREELEAKAISEEMIEQARYPYPHVHVENAIEMANAVANVNGAKMAARRLIKDAEFDQREGRHMFYAENLGTQDDLRTVAEAMQKLKPHDWPSQSALESYDDYGRLRRIGINDLPSLRAALREFRNFRGTAAKADPIKAAERALAGRKIPGYFPTPDALAQRMVDIADIKPTDDVLEPSAGKGNIADKLATVAGPGKLKVIEPVTDLRTILEAKGHNLVDRDFTIHEGSYDKIVMNPPFENDQDVYHVMNAFSQLKPGGRVVSIMSEHPFFANDAISRSFRDWLESVGGTSEKLPEGSFKDSERSTGVNTRLVVIDKPGAGGEIEPGQFGQQQTLEHGRKTGNEHLIAYDAHGKEIERSSGEAKSIKFSPEFKAAILNPINSIVAHHNHPSGNSFSPNDLSSLGAPGLKAVWAHGHNGNVYRAELTPEALEMASRVSPDATANTINRVYATADKAMRAVFQTAFDRRIVTPEEADAGWAHATVLVLQRAGLLDYRHNFDTAALLSRVRGLDTNISAAATAIRRSLFGANATAPDERTDRRSEPLRHPGDLGASFERSDLARTVGAPATRAPSRARNGEGEEGPSGVSEPPGIVLGSFGDPSKVIQSFKHFWTSTFQPELVSDRALTVDPLFAKYRSAQANEKDAIIRQSEKEWNYWNKRSAAEGVSFIDDVETAAFGAVPSDPVQAAMAKRYRAMLDANWAEEKRWGSTASFVEDYFPHIWERPADWRAFSAAKSAQMGPTWFQKKRTIDYITDGLAAGLTLKYTNPVDIIVHRLLSGVDMRQRMQLLYALKNEGLTWNTTQGQGQLIDRGWQMIVAPDRKQWVIHPDAQMLWKNAVEAKGLWQDEAMGGSMFRGWMAYKNAFVPVKLALSAFHPLHVLHINYSNGLGRGWDLLAKGHDPVGALRAVAKGFIDPITAAPGAAIGATLGGIAGASVGLPGWGSMIGAAAGSAAMAGLKKAGVAHDVRTRAQQAKEAWGIRPNSRAFNALTPLQKADLAMMHDGGFVPQLSEQLKIGAKRQLAVAFQKVLRGEAKKGDYWRVVHSAMRRGIEIMQAPIFERWIPTLKTAAYLDAASDYMRRNPAAWANNTDRRLALRGIAKSIDNRFGEMFYGNLFWNRYVKDTGIASFLSLGWNLGFVREFGGAAFEAVSRPLGLLPPLKPGASRKTIRGATNKIPFAIAYLASAALLNGLMNYAFTGDMPKGMDWIFARIGGENPDGSPRRVTNMFYLREVPMLLKHIQERGGNVITGTGEMIYNKMMIEPFRELLTNRDYYGYNIWDENAPIYKQIGQALHHQIIGEGGPMSVAGAQHAAELSGKPFPSAREAIEHPDRLLDALKAKGVDLSLMGFGPAPAYVEKTGIQNRISYLYGQHVAPASKPHADQENSRDKMAVRTAIMIARRDHDQDLMAKARERGKEIGLTPKYMGEIGRTPTDIYLFSRLPVDDQRSLLRSASPEEHAKYYPHASVKLKQEINRGNRGAYNTGTSNENRT